jgi:hypothetical protein
VQDDETILPSPLSPGWRLPLYAFLPALREWWLATRKIRALPSPFRRGGPPRKLLPLYRASEGGVKGQNPICCGSLCKTPIGCTTHVATTRKGAAIAQYRVQSQPAQAGAKCTTNVSGSTAKEALQSLSSLGDKTPKRKKLNATKRPSFTLGRPGFGGSLFAENRQEANH